MPDDVDRILAQWASERPDLDTTPMAVIGRLSRVARRLDVELARTFAVHELDAASFDVLATLRRSGDPFALAPKQLSDTAMITTGAVTQRLDKLEQRGLVRRSQRPGDGRGVLVHLTAAGRRAIDAALPDHVHTEQQLLSALTARQQRTLAHLLTLLLAGVEHTKGPARAHLTDPQCGRMRYVIMLPMPGVMGRPTGTSLPLSDPHEHQRARHCPEAHATISANSSAQKGSP